MKPFLKWAGSKYSIISKIKSSLGNLPQSRLIEPFVGSGAVFLNTNFDKYVLADNNPDLINLYKILKKEKLEFIEYARIFFGENSNTRDKFYENRELFNSTNDVRLKSALFLYLNKHSFNGLTRYNSKGIYNAPFGLYDKPYFPSKEMLNFANKSRKAQFKIASFEKTMRLAKAGDVVYCDPPYVPISKTSNFTNYTGAGFSIDLQNKLAYIARELIINGVKVIISNHDTEFTRKIYQGSDITSFKVQRFISCKTDKRIKAQELIAVFN